MRHPSTLALLLLAAVGVGYLVGAGRGDDAEASPVRLTETEGTLMTQDEAGNTLTFWTIQAGRPVSATEYYKRHEQATSGSTWTESRQLEVKAFGLERKSETKPLKEAK